MSDAKGYGVLPVSVLWVTGAPGVGKSTVAWGLYERAAGRPVAYVDIDQLGLLLPAPPGDPRYHRLASGNLVPVLETFRRYGARQVIVSGVVDPERGIDEYLPSTTDFDLQLIRLRCDRAELRRRFLGRGSPEEQIDELMGIADTLDRNAIGSVFDTTGLSPEAVIDALADRISPAAQVDTVPSPMPPVPGAGMPVLLLAGPTAVGKSTVGWEVLRALSARGIRTGYVDADQFGFHPSEYLPDIKAENMIHAWNGYRGADAQALIVVARGAPETYLRALAGELVTTVYLEASPGELARRIARRGNGEGPRLAGDSLVGVAAPQQDRLLARATAESAALRGDRDGALVIDTDRETPAAVAAKLVDLMLPEMRLPR
ncbi:AAA family ATPase [Nocardia arthritidis]|nr:AAA family ATPase [Nocardia arthritidis]